MNTREENGIDLFAKTPLEMFDELCENGRENPMTDDEIDEFVAEVRRECSVGCVKY